MQYLWRIIDRLVGKVKRGLDRLWRMKTLQDSFMTHLAVC
jgi:hypothetical protein